MFISPHVLLCIFCDWIGHNTLWDSLFCFTLRKWGSRSSKSELACITVSLVYTHTSQTYSHTVCTQNTDIKHTAASVLKRCCAEADCGDTCPLLFWASVNVFHRYDRSFIKPPVLCWSWGSQTQACSRAGGRGLHTAQHKCPANAPSNRQSM